MDKLQLRYNIPESWLTNNKYFRRLREIDVGNIETITNLNFLKHTLRKLICYGSSGVTQEGIKDLQLVELNCGYNHKIVDLNRMKNTLKKLECCWSSGVTQEGIRYLQLVELYCGGNDKIVNLDI